MSIKWMIKKSDFYGIKKSINKESDSKKLEQLKKEVIAILEKKESQEYKKAIEYFENSENHYTHLEKSITGEWIEKAGYGVGTVRIWKGKKYKKVSASPTRWVRVFDKNDRGAATSMGKYIAQVKKCQSVEELYQFCMKQRSLFQDENGVDLPIMDKLKAAIDEQGGKIERGEINTNNSADKNYIKNSRNKELKDKVNAAIKKYGATGQNLMNVLYNKDKELYNELDKMGTVNAKQFIMQTNADNEIKTGKEKTYSYETMGKKFTLKESEIKEELERATDLLNSQKGMLERAERNGETKIAKRIKAGLKEYQDSVDLWKDRLDKIKDGDYDESESEKHQNRSDAMKGNKKDISKMSKDEIISEMAKQVKLKNNRDENYYENLRNELNKINEIEYQAKKDAGNKINVDDFTLNKLGKKIDGEYPKFNKEQQKKLFSRIIEEFGESEKARKLIQNMQDFNSQKGEDLDINSYGDSWDYMKKQVGVGEPEQEDTHYWIQDSKGNRLTNIDAKKRIVNNLNKIDEIKTQMDSMDNKADKVHAELDIRKLEYDNSSLMDYLNKDDHKEMESEQEKHQNRSDAMKGNKNAYKGKAEEIANKRILSKEDMLNKPLTTIQKYANADVYNMDKFKTIDEALEDSFNTYKGSIDLGEVTKDELAERVGKEWAKKQNHDVAREIFKDYNAGKLTVNDDGILENNDEPVNNSPFGKTKISKAIEKYASDKQIKSTVNKISVEDFSSTDESRAAMNGVFHENGYNIATDGRMLSMIKADYPSEDEGKIKANKKYSKVFDKRIKQAREVLQENEKYLAEAEKQGKKLDPKFVNDKMRAAKAELENAEKTKESGVIDDKFPNYKKVIPSVAGNDVEPAKGFEDFNKILKIAKVAAAYKKNTKSSGVSVKVGDYNFNPDMLLNAVAMAEKHGLKNVNFRPNSYNPAQSPVEFSGDNGYVVIMPTLEDTYVFDADTGDVSSKYATEYTKDEELEKFLSGDSTKENVKKALLDLIDILDESEDEETDFEDNDASQPDLFNSTAYKVSAALDSVFNYR